MKISGRIRKEVVLICLMTVFMVGITPTMGEEKPLLHIRGIDLNGGAAALYGATQHGIGGVNFVYAKPTTDKSRMQAEFQLDSVPSEPLFLHLQARDDDFESACPIKILLNGKTIFKGASGFPDRDWATKKLAIPAGVLEAGVNGLVIANLASEGRAGMPPWFMVARIAIANEVFNVTGKIRQQIEEDFYVTLPDKVRPLPEPLADGQEPGFRIRGTKGWNWTPEQYLAEIPVLAKYKMNFLMNCYLTTFVNKPRPENHWYEPLPEKTRRGLEKVIKSCQTHGIDFCFAIHPQLWSPRPIDPTSDEDFELLWKHFAWAQELRVRWFSLPLDDVHAMKNVKIDASEHARLINKLQARLRSNDPQAQLIFCPTWYWGDGTDEKQKPYLKTLARELHKDVYLFWTGDKVVGRVTRRAAETFKNLARHRVILWDNYPVNDNHPTMHLGPVINRDSDLCKLLDGIMSNPLCTQNQINRIPLLTIADYAYNPAAYDPTRSIGQSIVHIADTPAQQQVLKDLVELYPGMLLVQGGPAWNPVITRFNEIIDKPHSRYLADVYLHHVSDVARRMQQVFGERFKPAQQTILNDIIKMKAAYADKYK
ncbi:MAG: beta-N-acetylglucosaminidase domain-containing protein [Planctomycetota bacterium]|jgi:hypothetical protein